MSVLSADAIEFLTPEPEPLWTFAYVSRPTIAFSEEELSRLHHTSEGLNRRYGLTGRLVVVERRGVAVRFVQCLEGPRQEIEAGSRRIFRDPRHGDIVVIQSAEISTRRFAGWSMHFETVAEADIGLDVAVALWNADAERTAAVEREAARTVSPG